MALQTPSAYGYEQQLNNLQLQRSQTAGNHELGRFMGQQRFNRETPQLQSKFRREQPRFGSSYNQRGMLNSGIYKADNQERFKQYQDYMSQRGQDQAWEQAQSHQAQRNDDLNYNQALLQLFEQFQAQRAGQNPFANYMNPFANMPQMGGI